MEYITPHHYFSPIAIMAAWHDSCLHHVTYQWVVEGKLAEALLHSCQVAVKSWGQAARRLLLQLPQA